MELWAVSHWPHVTGTSVTGRWPYGSPLRQRRSTCSTENPTWWSWSASENPQHCFRGGAGGEVQVHPSLPTFEMKIRFSFQLFSTDSIFFSLELCKTTQKGATCRPKPLKRYSRDCERLNWQSGGNRTATITCRFSWCQLFSFLFFFWALSV